jgi:hypothetical protein
MLVNRIETLSFINKGLVYRMKEKNNYINMDSSVQSFSGRRTWANSCHAVLLHNTALNM